MKKFIFIVVILLFIAVVGYCFTGEIHPVKNDVVDISVCDNIGIPECEVEIVIINDIIFESEVEIVVFDYTNQIEEMSLEHIINNWSLSNIENGYRSVSLDYIATQEVETICIWELFL